MNFLFESSYVCRLSFTLYVSKITIFTLTIHLPFCTSPPTENAKSIAGRPYSFQVYDISLLPRPISSYITKVKIKQVQDKGETN